jgi:hypothetical protein
MSTTSGPYTVANPGPIKVVNSWDEFRRSWADRQNFIIGKNVFPFHFNSPPLDKVIDTVRKSPNARILKGRSASKPGEKCPEFLNVPVGEVVGADVQVAHFEMLEFCAKGGTFAGLEKCYNQWYTALAAHGFSWVSSQRIFFHSGPHCVSGYHFDSSYVLAWQITGVKRFCWLKDPERWCPRAARRSGADFYDRMPKPDGITPDDVIEFEMHPGDVLWNCMLTPHWVYALADTTYSLNITHFDLACDGKLSPIDLELRETHRDRLMAAATAANA